MKSRIQVQSYALVLVADRETLVIRAASDLFDFWPDYRVDELLGLSLRELFPGDVVTEMLSSLSEQFPSVVRLEPPEGWKPGQYQIIVRNAGGELVIEIEPRRTWPHAGDYAARLNDYTDELQHQPDLDSLLQQLCDGLLYHFAFDRAILIQFDELHNGLVTHESRADDMPSLLDVHFVEADVPASTRENQLAETVLSYTAKEESLVPFRGEHSEISHNILRRHIGAREANANTHRYLSDSGLATLVHLSIIVDGKLWGSVYLHRREPLYLDYQMRAFLKVVGRVTQQKVAFHIYHRSLRMRQAANEVRDKLYDHIAGSTSLAEGLTAGSTTVLDLLEDTTGVAICSNDTLTLYGETPTEEQVSDLMAWLKGQMGDEHVWSTDQLGAHHTPAAAYKECCAGMLFLPLDPAANQWIIWFKPEHLHTVTYGSRAGNSSSHRVYATHQEISHNCSLPWTEDQIGTAQTLQWFVQKIVMERYASLSRSNTLLRQTYKDLEIFSYAIGHDLRAPLRGIASYADILTEDYAGVLDEAGNGYLRIIQQNADRMRVFMDDLLSLNHIDRRKMVVNELRVEVLVNRVLQNLKTRTKSEVTFEIQPGMPFIHGDRNYLLIVFTNLLSNAIKYSAKDKAPRVEVGHCYDHRTGLPVFYVSDNGIGVPESQHEKIFELFARSTTSEEYDGTGIGLALVDRIIRFHEGKIWIESKPGEGSTFYFYSGVRPSELEEELTPA